MFLLILLMIHVISNSNSFKPNPNYIVDNCIFGPSIWVMESSDVVSLIWRTNRIITSCFIFFELWIPPIKSGLKGESIVIHGNWLTHVIHLTTWCENGEGLTWYIHLIQHCMLSCPHSGFQLLLKTSRKCIFLSCKLQFYIKFLWTLVLPWINYYLPFPL